MAGGRAGPWNEGGKTTFCQQQLPRGAYVRAAKIAGAMLLLLAVLGGAIAVGAQPVLRWAIASAMSRIAQRQVRIEGPLSIAWGTPMRIVAEDVHVANAPWSARPDMFVAQRLEFDLLPPLRLDGPYRLPLVGIEHAQLLLERARNGRGNWDFLIDLLRTSSRRSIATINHAVLRDGTFLYRDDATGIERTLSAERLELDAPDPAGSARLAAEGSFQKLPLRLAGTVGPMAQLHRPPRPYPVAIEASLGENSLALHGTAARPLDLSGVEARLSLSGPLPYDVAAAFGLPLPQMPALRATGDLSGDSGRWRLKALSVTLGHSDIEGDVTLDLPQGRAPHLRAALKSGVIDLADFGGFAGKPPTSPGPARTGPGRLILPSLPVAARTPTGIDADLRVDADRVVTIDGLPLQQVAAAVHLSKGALSLAPLSFAVAGGEVSLDMRYDTGQKPPALAFDVDVRRVDLQRLLGSPMLPAWSGDLRGTAGGTVHVRSTGASLRDLLGRMNGEAALFAENGRFSQVLQEAFDHDALQALDLLPAGDQPATINCLVARFELASGVATAAPLLLDTSRAVLIGRGDFNFAAETMFLDLTPYHRQVTPQTWRMPVAIRGTFAAPSIDVSEAGTLEWVDTTPTIARAAAAALAPLLEAELGAGNACGPALAQPVPEPPGVGNSEPPGYSRTSK